MPSLKMRIKQLVEGNEPGPARWVDLGIQGLILASIVTFSIETLPDLDSQLKETLKWIEAVTVILFTIEYILRLIAADSKKNFVFGFYGLIDLCAILPFYVAAGIDLRSIRVFRLLRLLRVLKFARYTKAAERLRSALMEIKEELILFFILTVFTLYVAAVGIYYFESPVQPEKFSSIFSSLWWAVTTLTTVGYGDAYPLTVGGKIFTFLILMIGLGIVAIPTGLLSSALAKKR